MTGKNSYIMFQNYGIADFFALFLVGFTDKADDTRSIGMFGSGFKLAVTSSLRLGIDIILYIGRDKVTFRKDIRKVKGEDVEQLIFVREKPGGDKEEFQTNLTLGYGAKDWKEPWGVFREIMANCRDADPNCYEIVAGVIPQGREGFTRVFVQATEEIMDIYRKLDVYFKEDRHAIFSCEDGRIYPKSALEGFTNFYCKGIFVLTTHDHSLYDIDLCNMPINESRDASKDNLIYHVLNLYDMCPLDMKSEVLRYAINKEQQGVSTLEGSMYWTQTRRPHSWADAFKRAFPENVLCTYSEIEYQSMVQLGRKPIRAGHELYRMLSDQGIPTAKYVLQEENEVQRERFQPDSSLRDNFDKAFQIIAEKLPEIHMLNISFIRLPTADSNVSFIANSRARGEYQFSQTLLKSGVKAIGMALFDALAQTKSISGKCNMDYEQEMLNMAWECIINDTSISGNP